MKTLKLVGFAIALAAAPLAAQAATERQALVACANATISGLAGFNSEQMSYSIDDSITVSDRRLRVGGEFRIDIRDSKSGEVIASADCRYGRRAQVWSLSQLPPGSDDAKSRTTRAF